VAGAVGLLLCDIWAWFDGTQIDRNAAIHFGRGLQAVNILRNRDDDLQRRVDYYPKGWSREQMFAYARRNLEMAREGVHAMPRDAFKYLVEIPLLLAEATLDVLERGQKKLSRMQVLKIVKEAR
jgi:farnesyl-diphosphate farnesyltransferase